MCGRFSLAKEMEDLVNQFGLPFDDLVLNDLKPRYNIAPGQLSPVIIREDEKQIRALGGRQRRHGRDKTGRKHGN